MKPLIDTKLDATVNLAKLPLNAKLSFKLDKSQSWLSDILVEMNENAHDRSAEEWLAETEIVVELELMKGFKGEIGEYLLAEGTIRATYATECVRTLKPMKDHLEAPFKACFVPTKLVESEEYAETGEIWLDGKVWDIYGYERHQVPFSEMLHEQAFINYNYYPRLDADSPLDLDAANDETH